MIKSYFFNSIYNYEKKKKLRNLVNNYRLQIIRYDIDYRPVISRIKRMKKFATKKSILYILVETLSR